MEIFNTPITYSGKTMLNARGYISFLGRNNDDRYYWYCNLKISPLWPRRAVTLLVEWNHIASKFIKHNHPASLHAHQMTSFYRLCKKENQ